jgi:hypothetical protein
VIASRAVADWIATIVLLSATALVLAAGLLASVPRGGRRSDPPP